MVEAVIKETKSLEYDHHFEKLITQLFPAKCGL